MAFYRIVARQSWLGQTVANVFHVSDAFDNTTGELICDVFAQEYFDHVRGNASNVWGLDDFTYRDLDLVGSSEIPYVPGLCPFVGSNVGPTTPTQIAALISWYAGPVRPNRGRSYIAGMAEGVWEGDGLIGATPKADLQNFAQGLFDGLAALGAGVDLTLLGHAPGDPLTEVRHEIVSFVVRDVPATMRKRRIGVGS